MKRTLAALATILPLLAAAQGQPPPAAAGGKTQVTWYGHAAFVVRTPGGTVLAIDPWFSNPVAKKDGLKAPEKIDFILLTHAHSDHSGDAIALGKATGAKLVAPNELARALVAAGFPADPQKLTPTAGNIGGTLALTDEVSVTYVPAVHSSGFQKDPHVAAEYAGNPVGYLVRIKNGPTLYHTGDTDLVPTMEAIAHRWPVDVMLACIGGHFTMDPVGAATMAGWVKPKVLVPMHFGTYPILKGTPAELRQALQAQGVKTEVVEMKPGETRSF